jgi:lactaldehyde dehydrogenase/glycolaldehyde dehydrogenase
MSSYERSNWIDGAWETGPSTLHVINPANAEAFAQVGVASTSQVEHALSSARRALKAWSRLTGVERGRVLRAWERLVLKHSERLAQVITLEVGKPIAESRGEVAFGASWFGYYAEFDRRIEGEIVPPDRKGEQLWIIPQPVGVVVGIVPWNYPLAVAIRKIAPALIAGNTIVLKSHEKTPLSAIELMRLGEEAGVPWGVVNLLTGPGSTVGEALCTSDVPGLITFTGSVATGKRIMCNASDHVTAVSLELGGKAPFIVMDDADLDRAVEAAVFSRFLNCGQVCICNERTYVHRDIAREFTERFISAASTLRVGDPTDEQTQIGPKVSAAELEKVRRAVDRARSDGANVRIGGDSPDVPGFPKGFWYSPTVITDVKQDMSIIQDEIFGPVVPVMEFETFDEAVELANDSRYGLAGYLFTNDLNRLFRAVRDLEVGELYVNRGPGESIHAFHGGWKQSGIGGDDGRHGLDHYLRRKTVYVRFQG